MKFLIYFLNFNIYFNDQKNNFDIFNNIINFVLSIYAPCIHIIYIV